MEMAYHGMGFGLGFLNFIGTLLFFGFLLFFLLPFLLRGRWGWRRWKHAKRRWMESADNAAEVARERFARGDMSREEYERMRSGLGAKEVEETGGWKPFWERDRAIEVARMRYAKGEITLEQFQSLKHNLES